MSVLLICLQQNLVLVVTDTLVTAPNGVVHIGKSHLLAHIGAVVAGRGIGRLVTLLAAEAGLSGLDFDGLADWLPGAIDRLARQFADDIGCLPARDRANEIILAGWSPRAEGFAVHRFRQAAIGEPVERAEYAADDSSGGYVIAAPWDARLGPLPTLPDLDNGGYVAVARRQIDLMNRHWAPNSAGGDLVVTTITTDGVCAMRLPLLMTASTSPWTVPANWNSANNTIEVVGDGGGTGSGFDPAAGGAGGGYAKAVNVALTGAASIDFSVGPGGAGGAGQHGADADPRARLHGDPDA